MIFTLVMLIVLTVCLAYLTLASESHKEQEERDRAEYEARRERYLQWVRAKYAGEVPHGYRSRKHIDFTRERELTAAELEALKAEVMK